MPYGRVFRQIPSTEEALVACSGVISSYCAHLDLEKVSRHVDVIAAATLNSHGRDAFRAHDAM